jgi:hypothetical protein
MVTRLSRHATRVAGFVLDLDSKRSRSRFGAFIFVLCKAVMPCSACGDTGWVCEAHADWPWNDRPNACRCGEPGLPCPTCNEPAEGERPRMPQGFTPTIDRDKGR